MPFKFRLKSLLRHRDFMLREARAAFGASVSIRMRIQSGIDRLSEMIRLESDRLEKEQKNGIRAARYLHFKEHLSILERELLSSYIELEKASIEVERRKQAMIECDKSVKTLESIETRDKELYRLIQSRKEQKKLDDVAVFSVCRDRTGRKGES
ncbi:MAG: flagellar export protein FliJ [Syntrophobacteraceae bacterium]